MNSNLHTHWNRDDLLDRLYGLATRDGLDPRHVDECGECRDAWTALLERRETVVAQLAQPAHISSALDSRLRAQREAVHARLGDSWAQPLWRMAPAAATALLLVAGVILHQPTPQPVVTAQNHSAASAADSELFNDIETIVNEDGPRATQTIQALFDSNPEVEVQ